MDKNTLRKVYLEKRKLLSEAEYERRNRLLTDRLVEFFEANQFRNFHTFMPIKKNKEPDVFPFIQYLWSRKPKIDIITAISDVKKPILSHVKITENTAFLENKWGIPEPQDGESFPIQNIECVLVPMIVGSKSGDRIGYGKGYYDRFLVQCSNKVSIIGVSMAPLLDGTLYANQFDIQLDTIITPFEVKDTFK